MYFTLKVDKASVRLETVGNIHSHECPFRQFPDNTNSHVKSIFHTTDLTIHTLAYLADRKTGSPAVTAYEQY